MFDHEASNFHRTLEDFTAGFNSNRWMFGGDTHVTYRFELPRQAFVNGQMAFNVNYHTRGACIAEISEDGSTWREVGRQEVVGQQIVELPSDLFPSDRLFLRLRTSDTSDSFQVDRVAFSASLSQPAANVSGFTYFAETPIVSPTIRLGAMALAGRVGGAAQTLQIPIINQGQDQLRGRLQAFAVTPDQHRNELQAAKMAIPTGGRHDLSFTLPRTPPGHHQIEVSITDTERPAITLLKLTTAYLVPEYYRSDYGAQLPNAPAGFGVWWCDATRKVPRSRAVPEAMSPAVSLAAARNDHESVQVVVRGDQGLRGLTAKMSDLAGPGQAVISADRIDVRRVWYHYVHHPTDATGVLDWWPDALPPFDAALDVDPRHNQPIWLTVKVPANASPGDYTGQLSLRATGFAADVPVRLHVWNFSLPQRNHLETAFGMSPGSAFQYHNVKSDADRRHVLDLYFRSFSEHRISPYDPAPLDRIRTRFLADADPPRAELDFSAFDRAMTRTVDEFHFTGIRLPVEGMGGGTFHDRYPPQIAGFGAETTEYQAMFSSYASQLEQHLRDRDLLDMAYVYWFDEPAPRDYDFVTRGMERLKVHAPGLRRMLTEEPSDELQAPVDIWCPVTFNFDAESARERQLRGERIWWYVCTGPKAPYCTLFIDHPATELRVWLWQTWQYNVQGILIWASNYWTSSAAFPDEPQNPYLDPMAYVSGYSTPKGVKVFWGNGDGRFIYPPLAAATPSTSNGQPVLQPPVPSIRWEMLREGIEDYEFLWQLRDLLDRLGDQLDARQRAAFTQLLTVPESITKSMTEFTTDATPIYARRDEIARAIEHLTSLETASTSNNR